MYSRVFSQNESGNLPFKTIFFLIWFQQRRDEVITPWYHPNCIKICHSDFFNAENTPFLRRDSEMARKGV